MRIILVALCLYMMWGHRAKADVQAVESSSALVLPVENPIAEPQKFSVEFDISADSNLRDSSDPDHAATLSLFITPSFRISSIYKIKANLGIEQKLYADHSVVLTNTNLTLTRDPLKITDQHSLTLSATAVLPTNEIDRNEKTFHGGTGLAAGLLNKFSVFKEEGSFGYTLSLLKNYHGSEQASDLSPNLSHRIRHTLAYTQNFMQNFSIEILGRYQTGWTYQNALRTAFFLSEKMAYAMNKSSELYISHTNEGDALRANGIDSNIRIYDSSLSAFYTGVTVTY